MMLKGKTALVTGGRGGIGRAICARFAREGARVFAADLSAGGSLRDRDTAQDFLQLDVTSEDSVIAAFDHVAAQTGRLDILVNAAGIEIERPSRRQALMNGTRFSPSMSPAPSLSPSTRCRCCASQRRPAVPR